MDKLEGEFNEIFWGVGRYTSPEKNAVEGEYQPNHPGSS